MKSRQVAFFFGSGISRDSGAADVAKITEEVLNGNWDHDARGRFARASGQASDDFSTRVQELLRRLAAFLNQRFGAGQTCNYEDLYAAIRQLEQHKREEIVNPLIADFAEVLTKGIADLVNAHPPHPSNNPCAYTSLLSDASDLIQWVVFDLLIRVAVPQRMSAISEVARATSRLDIFSLNHDLLIEEELKRTSTRFSDGFEDHNGDMRVFNAGWESRSVRLYKLHGSINWYRAELPDFRQYVIPRKGDVDRLYTWDGKIINLLDHGQPMFLTGTTVKEQAYGTYLVGDMFCRFRKVLSEHRRLIVCGYGWLDREINLRLVQWLCDQASNKMIILHHKPIEEIRNKPFWRARWGRYSAQIHVEPRWLSECELGNLETFIEDL